MIAWPGSVPLAGRYGDAGRRRGRQDGRVQSAVTVTPAQLPDLLLHVAVVRPVFVWGAPGIGKSSLVRDFAESLGLDCVTLVGYPAGGRGPDRGTRAARRAQPVRAAGVDRPGRAVLPVPGRAERVRRRCAEGVLLADPGPAHRRVRAAGRLDRDRRRQPGHRQRARPADGVRAGEPARPRAPAGERRRLAALGGRGRHPPVDHRLPDRAPGPAVGRRRRRSRRCSPRRAAGTCSPTRCTPTATGSARRRCGCWPRGTLSPHARERILRVRQDRAAPVRAGRRGSRRRRLARRPRRPGPAVLPGRDVPCPAGQGPAGQQGPRVGERAPVRPPGQGLLVELAEISLECAQLVIASRRAKARRCCPRGSWSRSAGTCRAWSPPGAECVGRHKKNVPVDPNVAAFGAAWRQMSAHPMFASDGVRPARRLASGRRVGRAGRGRRAGQRQGDRADRPPTVRSPPARRSG